MTMGFFKEEWEPVFWTIAKKNSAPKTVNAWLTPWQSTLLATVMFVAVLAVDLRLPLGVAGGVPYVAVVLLGWWLPKR